MNATLAGLTVGLCAAMPAAAHAQKAPLLSPDLRARADVSSRSRDDWGELGKTVIIDHQDAGYTICGHLHRPSRARL
ncbi:MAG TPA: hypothetical protein VIF11_13175 [Methylomirabilota bacterium]